MKQYKYLTSLHIRCILCREKKRRLPWENRLVPWITRSCFMPQVTELCPRKGVSPIMLILLVENDHTNAQLFLHIFAQETPYLAFWANNGLAALHFTQHVRPQ